jgi:hypothetical protein
MYGRLYVTNVFTFCSRLEINAEKAKFMFISRHRNSGQNRNIMTISIFFRNVAKFIYLGIALRN